MSENEAQTYVDLIIENLVSMGIISEDKYGRMTENQRQSLAEKVVAASEE